MKRIAAFLVDRRLARDSSISRFTGHEPHRELTQRHSLRSAFRDRQVLSRLAKKAGPAGSPQRRRRRLRVTGRDSGNRLYEFLAARKSRDFRGSLVIARERGHFSSAAVRERLHLGINEI